MWNESSCICSCIKRFQRWIASWSGNKSSVQKRDRTTTSVGAFHSFAARREKRRRKHLLRSVAFSLAIREQPVQDQKTNNNKKTTPDCKNIGRQSRWSRWEWPTSFSSQSFWQQTNPTGTLFLPEAILRTHELNQTRYPSPNGLPERNLTISSDLMVHIISSHSRVGFKVS